MKRKTYNKCVGNTIESLIVDLFEYYDSVWDIIQKENYEDQMDESFLQALMMDRLARVYLTYHRQDNLLTNTGQILN